MQSASHDEDTGVVRSVLVCQGWHPNHHHGPRPHVKHIRTTGSCVARCPASRVIYRKVTKEKPPGLPGLPGLLRGTDASSHTPPHDFDESP
jgi:hypothetical protein